MAGNRHRRRSGAQVSVQLPPHHFKTKPGDKVGRPLPLLALALDQVKIVLDEPDTGLFIKSRSHFQAEKRIKTQPAADIGIVARYAAPLYANETDVCKDAGNNAVLTAAGDAELYLMHYRVAEKDIQLLGQGYGIRHRLGADIRLVADVYIPHPGAAAVQFHSYLAEFLFHLRHIPEIDEGYNRYLPGGEEEIAPGVSLGDVGQFHKLL